MRCARPWAAPRHGPGASTGARHAPIGPSARPPTSSRPRSASWRNSPREPCLEPAGWPRVSLSRPPHAELALPVPMPDPGPEDRLGDSGHVIGVRSTPRMVLLGLLGSDQGPGKDRPWDRGLRRPCGLGSMMRGIKSDTTVDRPPRTATPRPNPSRVTGSPSHSEGVDRAPAWVCGQTHRYTGGVLGPVSAQGHQIGKMVEHFRPYWLVPRRLKSCGRETAGHPEEKGASTSKCMRRGRDGLSLPTWAALIRSLSLLHRHAEP